MTQQLEALGLTPTEIRIALIIADGKSAVATARVLGRSHETVRKHLQSIFLKTNVNSQSALAVLVVRMWLSGDITRQQWSSASHD